MERAKAVSIKLRNELGAGMSELENEADVLIKFVKDIAAFKLSRSFFIYRTKDGIESQQERYPYTDYKDKLRRPLHSMPDAAIQDIPIGNFDLDYREYQHVQTERRGDRDVLVYLER